MLLSVVCAVALLGSCMSVPAPRDAFSDLLNTVKSQAKDALHDILTNGEETLKKAAEQYLLEHAGSLIGLLGKRDTEEVTEIERRNAFTDALKNILKNEAATLEKTLLDKLIGSISMGKRGIETELLKSFVLPKVNDLINEVLHKAVSSVESKLTELLNKL